MKTQEYHNEFFDKGQLISKYHFLEMQIPKNDAVYSLKEVMEQLDFSGLLSQYSKRGRTADSGYCSEKNFKFLKENKILNYIKLNEYEQKKKKKYKQAVGKHYNMEQITDKETGEYIYICKDGRKLEYVYSGKQKQSDETKSKYKKYECKNCSKCPFKKECLYNYSKENDTDDSRNKAMKIFHEWENLKSEAYENIQSEKGRYNRHIRSIQTEGSFGDMKQNDDFRRFNYRGTEKVYKEVLLYAFGRNINKYYRFMHGEIEEYKI